MAPSAILDLCATVIFEHTYVGLWKKVSKTGQKFLHYFIFDAEEMEGGYKTARGINLPVIKNRENF